MIHPSLQAARVASLAPAWKYASSVYLRKHHCVIYRDDELGIQKQVMTRRWTFIFPAREREYYFIDGDDRTFRTEDRLLAALRGRMNHNGNH